MTFFFLVIGLEAKRELVCGELRERRRIALPAVAAVGGMAVPVLIFSLVNIGGRGPPEKGLKHHSRVKMGALRI